MTMAEVIETAKLVDPSQLGFVMKRSARPPSLRGGESLAGHPI